jgi:hypothetical protein
MGPSRFEIPFKVGRLKVMVENPYRTNQRSGLKIWKVPYVSPSPT